MGYKVFTINPGSTTTKVALFEDDQELFKQNVAHDISVLDQFPSFADQLDYRKETIDKCLEEGNISLEGVDAFVGRGGGLLAMLGGTYAIDDLIVEHAMTGANGVNHPAQLGGMLASLYMNEFGGRGFVVNPPDVDEYQDLARVTGIDGVYRTSHIHTLNQKETAIRHSKNVEHKKYEECNYIVCHIGGGTSIAAHRKGLMVDGVSMVAGEGPMAPTRCGQIPGDELIRLCFSGEYSEADMLRFCMKTGGFASTLGTVDALEVIDRMNNGDKKAELYWNAMIYQICKTIGSMAAVLHGEVDAILLGGGMVYAESLVNGIKEACEFIAPVYAYPGEFEMEAMAAGAIRILSGEEEPQTYTGVPIFTGFDF